MEKEEGIIFLHDKVSELNQSINIIQLEPKNEKLKEIKSILIGIVNKNQESLNKLNNLLNCI